MEEDPRTKEIKAKLIEEEQEFKHALEKGIVNDDEDDLRILDSLPNNYKPQAIHLRPPTNN